MTRLWVARAAKCYLVAVSASRPTTGGRFVARRNAQREACILYDLELVTPEHEWRGVARLGLHSGDVDLDLRCLEESDVCAPAWLTAHVVAALRSAWRGLDEPASAALNDFPRRITRWRAPLPGQEPSPP